MNALCCDIVTRMAFRLNDLPFPTYATEHLSTFNNIVPVVFVVTLDSFVSQRGLTNKMSINQSGIQHNL